MSLEMQVEAETKEGERYIRRVRKAFDSGEHVKVVERVAMNSLARMVRNTPKGYTGNTRQSWKVYRMGGEITLYNTSKVMRFLEKGTKAHGPKKAKALYIPLNRSAAIGGWRQGLVFGVDYVLAKRVKGIKARHIVRDEEAVAKAELGVSMRQFLQELLNDTRNARN